MASLQLAEHGCKVNVSFSLISLFVACSVQYSFFFFFFQAVPFTTLIFSKFFFLKHSNSVNKPLQV